MSTTTSERPQGRLMKVSEVAERLAVSERTVWDWAASGDLRPIRLAKKATRFDSGDVERFIDSRRSA